MSKKILLCFILFIFTSLLLPVVYATDIVTPYALTSNTSIQDNSQNALDINAVDENISNTIDSTLNTESTTTTTTDYDDSSELSISNIINIILISVGIVLILLGIAIIIKLN